MEILFGAVTAIMSGFAVFISMKAIIKNKELKMFEHSQKHYRSVKEWYRETLLILKQLQVFHQNSENEKGLDHLLVKLSTQIDYGRLFFENIKIDDHGKDKSSGFQGYNPANLEFLIFYYNVFKSGIQEGNQEAVRNVQRAYVSEMNDYLRNNYNNGEITPYKLTDKGKILNIENFKNPKYKAVFENKDIVKLIKKYNNGKGLGSYDQNNKLQKTPKTIDQNNQVSENKKIGR